MTDRYGTHIPFLKTIAAHQKIESVIEFGCGKYSTSTFLSREIFRDLQALLSLESNMEWAASMEPDDRHTIIVCPPSEFISKCRGKTANLVFIDNGPGMDDRTALIVPASDIAPIIVLHDYGYDGYTEKIAQYKHIFRDEESQTAVMSQSVGLEWMVRT